MMEEFLKFMASPAGIAIFTIVALAIIIFFLAVNYRFFAKAFLDFLFGLIFFVIISPATAVCAVIVKKHAKKVCEKHWIVGKGGKPVCVRVFSDFSRGDKKSYISGSALKYFPLLLSVISGKMSLVGPSPISLRDGALIDDEYEARFDVRPGIFSSAALAFARRPEYEEMFAADCDYAKKRSLLSDVRAFFTSMLRAMRGEKGEFLCVGGEGYAEELLARGEITAEQIEEAQKLADGEVEELKRAKSRVG